MYDQRLKAFISSLDQWKLAGGQNYKGLVLNDGTVHTWPVDLLAHAPYHEDYMRANHVHSDQVRSYHEITPSNHYCNSLGSNKDFADKQAVQQALGLNMQEPSWAL